jgi:GNAT superfamily N-acetyltransferase
MAPIPRLDPVVRDVTGELLLQRVPRVTANSPLFGSMLTRAEDGTRRRDERNLAVYDYRVISFRGTVRGIMSLDISGDCIKLNQLFLTAEHQGQGIGERCMSLLLIEGQRLDLPIRLCVMKVNPRAKALYERLKFAVTGETETHFMMERLP